MPTPKGSPAVEHAALSVQAATTITCAVQSTDYPILHASTVVASSLSRRISVSGTTGRFTVGKGRWLARAYVRYNASAGTPTMQLKVYSGAAGSATEVTASTDQVTTAASGVLYVEKIVDCDKGEVIEFRVSNETGTENMSITHAFLTVTGLETSAKDAVRP